MSVDPHFGQCGTSLDPSDWAIKHELSLLFVRRIARVLEIFRKKGYNHYLGQFLKSIFETSKRHAGLVVIAALAVGYAWMFFHGPQGFQSLLDKRREIRQLEERNARQHVENEQRKERIRKLQESRSEQELEIRKQLKLQRAGETTFILPDSDQKEKETPSPE